MGCANVSPQFDWRDDPALWRSAAESPRAPSSPTPLWPTCWPRSHPSLDRAIREAERSTAILDRLDDEENLARRSPWRHVLPPQGRKPLRSAQSQVWYRKALSVLERARRIDLAGREQYNRVNLAHGKGAFQTGLGLSYLELGRVQRRLGQRQEALESLAYGRALSPIAEFSEEESQVYRDLGDPGRRRWL